MSDRVDQAPADALDAPFAAVKAQLLFEIFRLGPRHVHPPHRSPYARVYRLGQARAPQLHCPRKLRAKRRRP